MAIIKENEVITTFIHEKSGEELTIVAQEGGILSLINTLLSEIPKERYIYIVKDAQGNPLRVLQADNKEGILELTHAYHANLIPGMPKLSRARSDLQGVADQALHALLNSGYATEIQSTEHILPESPKGASMFRRLAAYPDISMHMGNPDGRGQRRIFRKRP